MSNGLLKISVVICTYNRADFIELALYSLYQQTLSKAYFEVIIVNNNSVDHTETVCSSFIHKHYDAHFFYLNELQQGASYARNTGAALAKAPLLCFMDDDAVAAPNYLEKIIAFFYSHTDAGGLGGKIIPRYIPEEPKWMSHFVSSMVGNFNYSNEVVVFAPNKYPLESNMVIKKTDFDAINGFNTALPGVMGTLRIGGEGKDFFLRLKALGRVIYYDPAIVVEHIVETKKLTPTYLYSVASGYGRGESVRTKAIGKYAYYKKIMEYLFKLGASFVLAIIYLLQAQPAKMRPIVQFRIDALKGLLGY
jgi:glucosyl-dolichyl phosphate glucuronosyltransferase